MNASYSLITNATNVQTSWYTCSYPGYTRGKSACWEIQNCEPMSVFLKTLAAFGFVSNLSVFILICAIERLHKPIYTGIRMLTIPDALFLLNQFLITTFPTSPREFKMVIIYAFFASFFSSVFHVVFLSLQQYLMIAYPLKCLTWIRNKRVLTASAFIWICAIILNIPYFYLFYLHGNHNIATTINTVYTVLFIVGPISVLAVLHVMKIIALKKSLVNNSGRTTQKVSRVISVVVGVYVITTAPINIRDIIELSICPMIDTWFVVLGHIGRTLLFVNHSINPYIYFISTPQFRKAVSICLGNKTIKFKTSKSSAQTEESGSIPGNLRSSSVNSESTSVSSRHSTSAVDRTISTKF